MGSASAPGSTDVTVIIFMVVMLLGSIAAFFFRAPQAWRYCKASLLANIRQSTTLSHLLAKPMLVRSAKLEDKAMSVMETEIMSSLLASFDHWLHRYNGEWMLRGIMFGFIYLLWVVGPILIDPRKNNFSYLDLNITSQSYLLTVSNLQSSVSTLANIMHLAFCIPTAHILQVLMVMQNVGDSLISFDKHASSMFTSGSMVTVVAHLLNYPTRISRVLHRDHLVSSSVRTSSASNSDSERNGEEGGELREIMTSHATAAFALILRDVCLRSIHGRPLLECLNLYHHHESTDDSPLRITGAMVPAGGIIGVRKSGGLDSEIDWMMLQLLGGWMLPDNGVARVLPSLQVELVRGVNVDKALFQGSLQDNLTYGVAWPVEDDALWQLCRRCGLSEQTIGASSMPGWAEAKPFDPVVITSPFTLSDNGIIVLVRAILQQPDVLLLHCVGELWGSAQQVHLIGVVRAFLDGSLPLPMKGGSSRASERPRTVLWAASDSLLISAMKREKADAPRLADRLITLESSSVATLAAPDEVFPSVDLDGTRDAATKALGGFQRYAKSSKERLSRSSQGNSTEAPAALAKPTTGPILGATSELSAVAGTSEGASTSATE